MTINGGEKRTEVIDRKSLGVLAGMLQKSHIEEYFALANPSLRSTCTP